MIAVEDLLSLDKIEIVLAHLLPRQIGKRFNVADDDRKLGTCGRYEIQALQFSLGLRHDFRRGMRSSSRVRN